jgi:aspartate aminotransferase
MPEISKRGLAMPASPIRKLVPFADAAKAKGIRIYHLNIGQPDIPTPQAGLDVLKSIDRTVLEYSPSDGYLSLRRKMAEYYERFGIPLTPTQIIVTTGGSEALQFAFTACLDHGDEVIITEPTYANYMSFATQAGVVVKTIRTRIEDGFALPAVEEFEKLIGPRTRAILICNPNNPTGYLYNEEEMFKLRDLVLRHDLFLFSDEVYREFRYTDRPYLSALHLEGIEQNVVVVDSVSKRYSECGIRIGALVTRNEKVLAATMRAAQARLSPPLLGQLVAEASIDAPESYMNSIFDEYIARRDFLVDGLNKIPGVYTPMPGGAFYTIARLPIDDSDKFCEWLLSEFSYEGATVMFAPASGFYATPGAGQNEVRIAYVLNREALAHALTILEKALEAYPGKR